jgi:alpha-beta hydrolase superfamily lysophospholipase
MLSSNRPIEAAMRIETQRRALVPLAASERGRGRRVGDHAKYAGSIRYAVTTARHRIARAVVLSRAVAARAWPQTPHMRARAMTILGWSAAVALVFYIGLAAMIYLAQRSLMYFPDTVAVTPAAAGLPEAQEVPLVAADGVRIHVWHVPPRDNKPVLLYFHGNGGALRYRVERFHRLVSDGIGLIALEYRGYGGLGGSPSEAGLIADAHAAYDFAVANYPPQQIVLWGESLGSGVAVALAAERPVGRVILEAPFTSAEAVGARHYWYLPVRLLMKDQFRSDKRIGKVAAPLMIMHGVHDRVVPYAMGEELFNLANKPKHIVRFLDGGHEDLDAHGALDAVARFLAGDLD